jgi:hypothetical protein
VKADPAPRPPVKVTAVARQAALGGTHPQILVAPSTPGPFLASGLNDFPQHKQEIWNLETLEKTGQATGFRMASHGILSPDGAYLAGTLNDARTPFVVVACKDSTKVIDMDSFPLAGWDFLDFAGPRQLLIGVKGNIRGKPQHIYHLYEVPSGRKLREVATVAERDEKSEALSAGGKYLALKSRNDVLIYDLQQGAPAGKFTIPNPWTGLRHRELAFSPDGKELAVYMEASRGLRILTWDLEGNRLGADYTLPPTFVRGLRT